MAHVFISHRKADHVEAERLASELRAAGHTLWFDEWNIQLGDSIVERVNEGLEGASYLVLCCSASGDSPWMGREWMSTLMRQLSGARVKLLPVVLTGGRPPAILADIKPADFVKDWSRALKELLQALR
ncbi:toll/interleukin-1 receptor domain-containing protein [Archangium sp.]|uniref:toll/interleukin-1 receptor domain-containing protein n=1 Tax=Archangium sp. TaxID=1872627 RepID=UPI00286A52A0|nr:toll/interleukin-1 receptor domain-containing protein [Archangium sp.]